MKTTEEIMEMVREFGFLQQAGGRDLGMDCLMSASQQFERSDAKFDEIRAALTALASGECSVAGLADDLRLVAKLESKRMGAMSSGLLKGVIDRLSALPPPPEEGTVA